MSARKGRGGPHAWPDTPTPPALVRPVLPLEARPLAVDSPNFATAQDAMTGGFGFGHDAEHDADVEQLADRISDHAGSAGLGFEADQLARQIRRER